VRRLCRARPGRKSLHGEATPQECSVHRPLRRGSDTEGDVPCKTRCNGEWLHGGDLPCCNHPGSPGPVTALIQASAEPGPAEASNSLRNSAYISRAHEGTSGRWSGPARSMLGREWRDRPHREGRHRQDASRLPSAGWSTAILRPRPEQTASPYPPRPCLASSDLGGAGSKGPTTTTLVGSSTDVNGSMAELKDSRT
jgi:hypothetical protein